MEVSVQLIGELSYEIRGLSLQRFVPRVVKAVASTECWQLVVNVCFTRL